MTATLTATRRELRSSTATTRTWPGDLGIIGDAGAYSHWATDATEEWVYTAFSISGGRACEHRRRTRPARTPSGACGLDYLLDHHRHHRLRATAPLGTPRDTMCKRSRCVRPGFRHRPGLCPADPRRMTHGGHAGGLVDVLCAVAQHHNPAPLAAWTRACDAARKRGFRRHSVAAYLMPLMRPAHVRA